MRRVVLITQPTRYNILIINEKRHFIRSDRIRETQPEKHGFHEMARVRTCFSSIREIRGSIFSIDAAANRLLRFSTADDAADGPRKALSARSGSIIQHLLFAPDERGPRALRKEGPHV